MSIGASTAMARSRASAVTVTVSIVIIGATACWAAAMIASTVGVLALPISSGERDAALVAYPALLAAFWATSRGWEASQLRPRTTVFRAAQLSALVAVVLLLTPHVLSSRTLPFALPGLVVGTWVVYQRPVLGVFLIAAITASFGSLSIYLGFPYKKTAIGILGGLWLASLLRAALQRRRAQVHVPFGVLLVVAYLVISIVEVILSNDSTVALGGFELAPLFLSTVLVVAYSRWSRETHQRIVKWLLLIAVAAGAYAVLRLVIGPSASEQAEAGASPFNFVNGKLKLIGSFLNGADLAEWTALMIPFCLSCALGLRGRMRAVACLALPLLTIALFGSQVRAAAVAAVAAVLATALAHGGARAFHPGVRLGQTTIAVVLIVVLVGGAYAVAGRGGQNNGHSYIALITGNSQDVSVSTHEYKWAEAFRDLGGHPFGYGLGSAPAGYVANAPSTPYVLPVTGFSADNGFLKIALEQGFSVSVVLALALALLAGGLARGGMATRDPLSATIALGAVGTAVSFFVLEGAGAFADGVPAIVGWLVIGLGLAQFVVKRSSEGQLGPVAQD